LTTSGGVRTTPRRSNAPAARGFRSAVARGSGAA
jgi:hypothetical protein